MKLLDKLKNALFEEEYVEIEEKKEVKKKENPIAKKIIVDDKPKKPTIKEELIVEEEKKETPNRDFKFKAILDDDFIDLEQEKKEEKLPKLEPRTEPKKEESRREFKVKSAGRMPDRCTAKKEKTGGREKKCRWKKSANIFVSMVWRTGLWNSAVRARPSNWRPRCWDVNRDGLPKRFPLR